MGLFSLLEFSILLLGKQLFDVGLWRCDFTVNLANVGAARESFWGADVWSVREPPLCDSHPSYQPRDEIVPQLTLDRTHGRSFGLEELLCSKTRKSRNIVDAEMRSRTLYNERDVLSAKPAQL